MTHNSVGYTGYGAAMQMLIIFANFDKYKGKCVNECYSGRNDT